MEGQKRDVFPIYMTLFVLFFCIAVLFPYTGDDWTWGSDAGLAYLETFFADYNGRYLGNLLVLALTRSKLLDAVVMAVSYVMVCFFCYQYSEDQSKVLLWFAAVLFFIMPKEIWAQTIVWTSGYSNYVPSALITAAFLLSVRKATYETFPVSEGTAGKAAWMLLGFAGALFVENITVFNIGFALVAILYTFLRFRKMDQSHLAFFVGAILGAWVMFSNSVYHKIVQGDDYYRNTPKGIGESLEMILEHARDILTYIIYDNILFCGIVTVLLVVLTEFRKEAKEKPAGAGPASVLFHLGSFLLVLWKDSAICLVGQFAVLPKRAMLLLEILIALTYVFSIFLVIFCYVEQGRRLRLFLPLCCAAGTLMPLLVVSPIGPRCVFVGYFFMMVFVVDLAGYLRSGLVPESKWFSKVLCLVALIQAMSFVNIYYPVYCSETLRTEFVKKQAENGSKTVLICELPNKDYLWNSNPTGESLPKRYKVFHKLDADIELDFVSLDELKALSETYK